MLKEIFEQPQSIRDSIRGRMFHRLEDAGIDDHWDKWNNASRIIILGCGTSWHESCCRYLFEDFARIPVGWNMLLNLTGAPLFVLMMLLLPSHKVEKPLIL